MDERVCSATAWEIQQVCHQIVSHMRACEQRPGTYVEIGSFRGGSLCHYGGAMPVGSTLIAVDRPLAHAGTQLYEVADDMRQREYQVHLVSGDSHSPETLSALQELLGTRLVDVLLIDGDHSQAGCRKDLEMYVPLVRPGGLVVMHDCGAPGCSAKEARSELLGVQSGLHPLWREFSRGRRSLLLQEWPGYGLFWV